MAVTHRPRLKKSTASRHNYINTTSHAYARRPSQPARKPIHTSKSKPRPPQAPKPVRRRKKIKKKKAAQSYKIEISTEKNRYFLLGFTIFVIFFGAFLCVFSGAYLDNVKMRLNEEQRELNRLIVENTALRGEINDSYDLAEYEKYAIEELGMRRPPESQIVYVELPKITYVEQFDPEYVDITPYSVLDSIIAFIKDLFHTEEPVTTQNNTN